METPEPTIEQCYTELGRIYMETVRLRQALGDQQRETARMATALGRERLARGGGLVESVDDLTPEEARQTLEKLNERLMGRADPRPQVENVSQKKAIPSTIESNAGGEQ